MGGPGSGRKKGSKNRPGTRTMSQQAGDPRNVEPRTLHAAIVFGNILFGLKGPDLSDAEAVERRWFEFMEICDENHVRPMVTGMAMAFNIPNANFRQVVYGTNGNERYKGITPESRQILKKGYEFLQFLYEYSMENDVHNPAKYIFLMKNYFGYTDQTVNINISADQKPTLPSAEDVAEKYKAMVGRPTLAIEAEAVEVIDDSPTPGDSPTPADAGDSATLSDSRDSRL